MIQKTRRRPQFSPLRYPGGKSALFGLVNSSVRENGATGGTYVEPYAGGAGLALGLLLTEHVESVVINDLDPAIYSFWRAVTRRSDEFMERVRSVELTMNEWNMQRHVYTHPSAHSDFDLGFATFFLNRTNRSGVLNAGAIGGKNQSGPYKIDARFNRATLLERCRLISLYSDRIDVRNEDGLAIIDEFAGRSKTFIYADPPYFEKGSQLYLNAFKKADHESLAQALNSRADSLWMLTYDDAPTISSLYSARRQFDIGVYYSVRNARKASELLIASDSFRLPEGHATHRA
ncbi:DNA adenine methylase [Frigoribacterium sp. CFBP 8754]|uniref:DNA adenine methylase n=1 Tax=Frigoribacterium sp. CFBP 8754 TaxID=2775290 RepID=UPI0017803415|nr:DNA adenine methylase [Frigoribacterium sp. CFBP 8754]MBD8660496.1 DNA adenine methylase [Frigoribacterium sp. CFBP 8754]